MTTIVWHRREQCLIADGRSTLRGRIINDEARKIFKFKAKIEENDPEEEYVIGFTGLTQSRFVFFEILEKIDLKGDQIVLSKIEFPEDLDFEALMVETRRCKTYVVHSSMERTLIEVTRMEGNNLAIGSGEEFAIGAMEANPELPAIGIIDVCKRCDSNTGGLTHGWRSNKGFFADDQKTGTGFMG